MQRVRQRSRGKRCDELRKNLDANELAITNWETGGTHRRPPGPIQYAWVVEPHASGWPHIHLLIGVEYIDYNWLRDEWRKIVRTQSANVHCERVHDVEGACRYLSKYISKSVLTLDILAVMHRRRIFGTTIPTVVDKVAMWSVEKETHSDTAYHQAHCPRTWGINEGWQLHPESYTGCTVWSRSLEWSAIAKMLPERRILQEGPFVFDALSTLPPALARLLDPGAFLGRSVDIRRVGWNDPNTIDIPSIDT
jgi:hypothetical protein